MIVVLIFEKIVESRRNNFKSSIRQLGAGMQGAGVGPCISVPISPSKNDIIIFDSQFPPSISVKFGSTLPRTSVIPTFRTNG